jgi:hypothetical protein
MTYVFLFLAGVALVSCYLNAVLQRSYMMAWSTIVAAIWIALAYWWAAA